MVRSMLTYKTKIDQLKQEKANIKVSYESQLAQYRGHVTNVEHENMMLVHQLKQVEAQVKTSYKNNTIIWW